MNRVGPALYTNITIDDVVAFNRHALQTSPLTRKVLRRTQWRMLPSLLIFVAWIWVMRWNESQFLFSCGMVLVGGYGVSILLLGTITELRLPGRIRRQVADGFYPPFTPSRLWVDVSGGVVDESPDRTTWYAPSAIEKIEETPDHVFVYVGPGRALIIPRRPDEEAVRAFVQALTWHRAEHDLFAADWR